MIIRPAAEDDLSAIQDCANRAYSPYIARIGRKPAPMTADFGHKLSSKSLFVAVFKADEREEALAGFICFYPQEDHMHLENVAVDPNAQGRGIGRALIKHCEDDARRLGLKTIALYTNEAMTENMTLYPRLGYTETHRARQDGFNRVFFRKALTSDQARHL